MSDIQMTNADGTVHFTELKAIALSGKQYLERLKPVEPTAAMLLGTAVHQIILGPRPGKDPLAIFPGAARRGKAWDEFAALHSAREIVTLSEWTKAEDVAAAVKADPVAASYLDGASFEVPLEWEENGMKCSTSGVDILGGIGGLGDLKTTSNVHPETLMRKAFQSMYHAQIAFYLRGAKANGIVVTGRPFLVCVETRSPFEVVVLELSDALLDLGDKTVSLWIERLKCFVESRQFPGYAQSALLWDVPSWLQGSDEEADDEGEEVAA